MGITLQERLLRTLARRPWLRGRDRVLRMFANPDNHPSRPFEVDFFGKRYSGNLTNFIDWWVFYYGAFAHAELQLLGEIGDALRARGKPVNFYDVGANIGHHTLYMSSHADRCFAFEPFSVVRKEMERKLAHAGVQNVNVFPVALGETTAIGSYCPPTGANQGTGTLGEALPDNASTERIDVEVVRGDELFQTQGLPPISLLKLDVEGFEVPALRGLRETLWRDRPPILMEIQQLQGRGAAKESDLLELLYPDRVLFEVRDVRWNYELHPLDSNRSDSNRTDETLVLPRELADIVRGSSIAR